MARKVFFSFHYERDGWRAANVRNSDMLADEDEYGVIDKAEWEKIEREGEDAIKRWIESQLKNTSVTVVLIGAETADRKWVRYELRRSWKRGNGIVGLRIHQVENQDGETDVAGANPLDQLKFTDGTALSSVCKTYDWVSDDGRENLGDWVEAAYAAREAFDEDRALAEEESGRSAISRAATGPTIIQNPPRPWAR